MDSKQETFTPGPWHWRPEFDEDGPHADTHWYGAICAATGEEVCTFGGYELIPFGSYIPGIEPAEPDRRMMIAAPAMADALRDMLEHAEWSTPQGKAAFDSARAILSAIEGKD